MGFGFRRTIPSLFSIQSGPEVGISTYETNAVKLSVPSADADFTTLISAAELKAVNAVLKVAKLPLSQVEVFLRSGM